MSSFKSAYASAMEIPLLSVPISEKEFCSRDQITNGLLNIAVDLLNSNCFTLTEACDPLLPWEQDTP